MLTQHAWKPLMFFRVEIMENTKAAEILSRSSSL